MVTRELKLKLNSHQEKKINEWLFSLAGVYNWAYRKIELNAKDKIYFSKFDFINLLSDHGRKINISSHTIQGILSQIYDSWDRFFNKKTKKPKMKSTRNKLNSIPFPDVIPSSRFYGNNINLPM